MARSNCIQQQVNLIYGFVCKTQHPQRGDSAFPWPNSKLPKEHCVKNFPAVNRYICGKVRKKKKDLCLSTIYGLFRERLWFEKIETFPF